MLKISPEGTSLIERTFGKFESLHDFFEKGNPNTIAELAKQIHMSFDRLLTESEVDSLADILGLLVFYFADKEQIEINEENLNSFIDAITMTIVLENMIRKNLIVGSGIISLKDTDARTYMSYQTFEKSHEMAEECLSKFRL